MTPDQVKLWRGGKSQAEAGKAVGRSGRQIRDYEAGKAPVPLTVELACIAVDQGYSSYDSFLRSLSEDGLTD